MATTRLQFDRLRQVLPAAAVRALNRAIAAAQTVAVREIRADLRVPARRVREGLRVERAASGRFRARLIATGRRIPLVDFRARGPEPSRGRGRGVTYELQGQRRRIPSGFLATMRTGHRGVFVRTGRARLPIVERFGPSIVRVFRRGPIQRAMRARAAEVVVSTLRADLAFRLGRLAR